MITEQQYRQNLQRIVDALNAKDWGALDRAVDELFVTDYVLYFQGASEPVRGGEGWKNGIRSFVESASGYRATIEDVLVLGDKAVARLMAQGTDPLTGKAQHRTSIMINHLKDGKFAQDWQVVSPWEDDA